jgi:hypothetical protein
VGSGPKRGDTVTIVTCTNLRRHLRHSRGYAVPITAVTVTNPEAVEPTAEPLKPSDLRRCFTYAVRVILPSLTHVPEHETRFMLPLTVTVELGRHFGCFISSGDVTEQSQVKRQRSTGLTEGCAEPGINTSSFPVQTSVVLSTSIVSNSLLLSSLSRLSVSLLVKSCY